MDLWSPPRARAVPGPLPPGATGIAAGVAAADLAVFLVGLWIASHRADPALSYASRQWAGDVGTGVVLLLPWLQGAWLVPLLAAFRDHPPAVVGLIGGGLAWSVAHFVGFAGSLAVLVVDGLVD